MEWNISYRIKFPDTRLVLFYDQLILLIEKIPIVWLQHWIRLWKYWVLVAWSQVMTKLKRRERKSYLKKYYFILLHILLIVFENWIFIWPLNPMKYENNQFQAFEKTNVAIPWSKQSQKSIEFRIRKASTKRLSLKTHYIRCSSDRVSWR